MEVTFSVLGKKWRLRLLSKKDYVKNHGKLGTKSIAITDKEKRLIDLGPDGRDRETIIHELVHAYLSEICVTSMDIEEDNMEELFAELMAKWGFQLLAQADDLFWGIQ